MIFNHLLNACSLLLSFSDSLWLSFGVTSLMNCVYLNYFSSWSYFANNKQYEAANHKQS